MSVRHNKGLEQTGSAGSNGTGRPCSSIQCCAGCRKVSIGPRSLALALCAGFASVALCQEPGPPPVPTPLRIGDNACAVMLEVQAKVVDSAKRPVEGAKVSLRHVTGGKDHLHPVGVTDARGHLIHTVCYQDTSDYYASPPNGDVTLTFVVSSFHYKDHEMSRIVSAESLLREGLLWAEVRPRLLPRPGLKPGAAFRVKIEVVLRDVA